MMTSGHVYHNKDYDESEFIENRDKCFLQNYARVSLGQFSFCQ